MFPNFKFVGKKCGMLSGVTQIAKIHLKVILISVFVLALGILSSNPAEAQKKEASYKDHYSKKRYKQLSANQSCKITAKKKKKFAQPPLLAKRNKKVNNTAQTERDMQIVRN